MHYYGEEKNWEAQAILPDLPLEHTMYLVGDAGYVPDDGVNPVLTYLKAHLATESKDASLVFLGDNIYPEGMPRKSAPTRAVAEERLILSWMWLRFFLVVLSLSQEIMIGT